jgi:hypothetical protein
MNGNLLSVILRCVFKLFVNLMRATILSFILMNGIFLSVFLQNLFQLLITLLKVSVVILLWVILLWDILLCFYVVCHSAVCHMFFSAEWLSEFILMNSNLPSVIQLTICQSDESHCTEIRSYEWHFLSRFFKIRLGLYSKKFRKCLINYLGLSYEQTVMSQLYLLVNHLRDCSSLLWSLWYSLEVWV